MRRRLALLLALSSLACAPPPAPAATAELGSAPRWLPQAHELGSRGELRLLALPEPRGPEQTDVRLARSLAVIRDHDAHLPPGPALAAQLLDGSVAWALVDGTLLLDALDGSSPRTLDRDVIPELAASPDGRTLAYARRPGDEAGVWLVSLDAPERAPRLATPGLAIADRPLFASSSLLLVVGAVPSGIAGVWAIDLDREASPRPLTNAQLRTGAPLGPTFVPPPASHASMRIDGGELVYDDGEREQRVEVR